MINIYLLRWHSDIALDGGNTVCFIWHEQSVAGDCAAGTFPQHNLLQLLTVQDSSGALLNIGADRSYILGWSNAFTPWLKCWSKYASLWQSLLRFKTHSLLCGVWKIGEKNAALMSCMTQTGYEIRQKKKEKRKWTFNSCAGTGTEGRLSSEQHTWCWLLIVSINESMEAKWFSPSGN